MRHLRMLALCLVAVFALGAIVAAAAQAEGPEWGRCVKLAKNKGKYKDANCQELEGKTNGKGEFKAKAKGFYEWEGGASTTCYKEPAKKGKYKNATCTELEGKTNGKGEFKAKEKGEYEKVTGGSKFTSSSTGGGVLYVDGYVCYTLSEELVAAPRADCGYDYSFELESQVECTHESASGEAVGSDEIAHVSARFVGCQLDGAPMETPGLGSGEIQVNELKGRIGYIDKAKHEVGVLLQPADGGRFAEFGAPALHLTVTVGEGDPTEGSFYEETGPGVPTGNNGVISPITPVNKMTHQFTQDYRVLSTPNSVRETVFGKTYEGCGQELCGSKYENVPSHFEGGPNDLLETLIAGKGETYTWSPSGQELTNVNTEEGEAEIKA